MLKLFKRLKKSHNCEKNKKFLGTQKINNSGMSLPKTYSKFECKICKKAWYE